VGPFHIAPPWDEAPCGDLILLRVDPGRAFGTGTHESTRLCLLSLAALADRAPLGRVADIGTGSGILAVAAARLGAHQVVALDSDVEAVHAAATLARLNGVDVALLAGDAGTCLRGASFDLVLANLSAPLLSSHAGDLARLCRRGARIVLAGLLASETGDVRSAFPGMELLEERLDGEWAALVLRPPTAPARR
jgi:ribosomal protein L11 methyltransferase